MSHEPANSPKVPLKKKTLFHRVGRRRRRGADSEGHGENSEAVSVPPLRQLAPHDRPEITTDGARALMCAFILQAVYDVDAKLDYLCKNKNEEMRLHQISAIAMIRSPFFARLCGTLRLPADKIVRKALS